MNIKISAFVLAGGFSRRFGTNKALFPYNEKPLISYPLEILSKHCAPVSIVAKNPEEYDHLDYPVVRDIYDQQTPLVGILTGLQSSGTDWNFIAACDMPFITSGFVSSLIREIPDSSKLQAVIPEDGDSLQPLAGFYHRSLIPSVAQGVKSHLSVIDWLQDTGYKTVHYSDSTPFRNVNTREDLHAITTD